MDDVIAFQSASFPAEAASDPTPGQTQARAIECLRFILASVTGEAISVQLNPVKEGSGSTAFVESHGTCVAIHLTWHPAGPPRAKKRDTWTIQVGRSGGWMRDVVRRVRGRPDRGLDAVFAALLSFLRERTEEFSEVRVCAWRDLDA